MKLKRFAALLLACAVTVNGLGIRAGAAHDKTQGAGTASVYATGRFSMDIPGKTLLTANSSFPLEVGETVTIKATYSPFNASVDFGLIAPDGLFYSLNTTNGSFDETFEIDQRGNYTFAVRNNSSGTISVSGYVNY